MRYLPKKITRRALIDFCTANSWISSGSSDLGNRKINIFDPEDIHIPFFRIRIIFHKVHRWLQHPLVRI